jgi:REP element-mobilizing transposase RayT
MPRVARRALPDGTFRAAALQSRRDVLLDAARLLLATQPLHLIVEAKRRDLSEGMQKLNGRYAKRFNERYDRVGHVFQNRSSSYVIESGEHFVRALAYVRANPLTAGPCENVDDWLWSTGPSDSD